VLPYPRRSFSGYRLLQEYWAFPQKFHFIEVSGLAPLRGSHARSIELTFLLDREPRIPHASITGGNFSLSCVPLVNLFETNADPIRLTPYTSNHDVVPDAQRPLDLEVYSVEEVAGLEQGTRERSVHAPFYSVRHDVGAEATRSYWHTLRRASRKKGDDGTEVSIALVDLDLERAAHTDETLHVRIVCTNRDTPFQSSEWGRPDDFRPEGVTGVAGVRCVHAPTRTLRPRLGGSQHWRMISQLSLNYLSIVREGRDALREILRVYDISDTPGNREQVEGIVDVRSEPSVRWIQTEAGGGFGRGTRTTVVIDRDRFVGSCPLLLASIIERFLARYCAVNSFSELSLETPQDQGEVHRWNPRAGDRVLL